MNHNDPHFLMMTERLLEQKERLILDQLGGLVKDGLLVVVQTPAVIVKDPTRPNGLRLEQSVCLKLRDQEVIDGLKKRVSELEQILDKITAGVKEWMG